VKKEGEAEKSGLGKKKRHFHYVIGQKKKGGDGPPQLNGGKGKGERRGLPPLLEGRRMGKKKREENNSLPERGKRGRKEANEHFSHYPVWERKECSFLGTLGEEDMEEGGRKQFPLKYPSPVCMPKRKKKAPKGGLKEEERGSTDRFTVQRKERLAFR